MDLVELQAQITKPNDFEVIVCCPGKRWGVGNTITSSPYGPHGEHPERWRANGTFPFPTKVCCPAPIG